MYCFGMLARQEWSENGSSYTRKFTAQFYPLTPTVASFCHMSTAIKHPVPDRIKQSFVIFDIWALWRNAGKISTVGLHSLQQHTCRKRYFDRLTWLKTKSSGQRVVCVVMTSKCCDMLHVCLVPTVDDHSRQTRRPSYSHCSNLEASLYWAGRSSALDDVLGSSNSLKSVQYVAKSLLYPDTLVAKSQNADVQARDQDQELEFQTRTHKSKNQKHNSITDWFKKPLLT